MCGIAGIKLFNSNASKTEEDELYAALHLQRHRGPDFSKVTLVAKAALGHNRLSIIDTHQRSHQPFSDDRQRYFLVFNGEIYNHHELKKPLLDQGVHFQTSSDTEVLFHHLIQHGSEGLEHLRGCFAFAFYDAEQDWMLLARDRMGINPLLYAYESDRLIFGSELDVFAPLGVGTTISTQALNDYFQYTYIPAPFTIYQEVQKLLPGHYLEIKGSQIKIERYWDPLAPKTFNGNYEQAKKTLVERLEYGVESQLEADVPIGTFLSGGVDSSLVSAIAARKLSELHTFSVSFTDQATYDESPYAELVAKHIGSTHHIIRLGEADFIAAFQQILASYDEPFADSSAIAMWFLSQETAQHLKVALSGDGADELFGGYNKHKAFMKSMQMGNTKKGVFRLADALTHPFTSRIKPALAHKLRKFNELSERNWPENYWYLASNIGENSRNKLLKQAVNSQKWLEHRYKDFNDFLYLDQLFVLPNDMLKKVDLMSMRHSLEVRTPFMDKDLVHFANSLPPEWKLDGKTGKKVLRDAFKGVIPDQIFTRSKQGFEVPFHRWIANRWESLIPSEWFSKGFLEEQNLFDFDAVLNLKKRFLASVGTAPQEMWAYLVFQHWYINKHRHGKN